jgi:HEAT repeat protein
VMIALLLNYAFKTQIGARGELTALKQELTGLQQTVSLALLDHDAATDRLQGIQFTKQLSEPDASLLNRLIDRLNHDPSINVRLAAADALYLFGNHPVVQDQLSASLQHQESPLVQMALIDLLSDLRIQRASQALKTLIQNQAVEIEVRNHAQTRLNDMM